MIVVLRVPRRFAGAERCPRLLQIAHNPPCERVRAAEHAPRDPLRVLERRHGLAEIVEGGAGVIVERHRMNPPQPERDFITIAKNASRHGNCFAHQRLGFFEVP